MKHSTALHSLTAKSVSGEKHTNRPKEKEEKERKEERKKRR